jgi:3-dehydroquinate synthetase
MMAMSIGLLDESEAARIIRVVAAIGPLPPLKGINLSKLKPIMTGDKKSQAGKILWVLPTRIGKTEWNCEVPWPVVSRVFAELPAIAAKAA